MPGRRVEQSPSARDSGSTRWVHKYRLQRERWREEREAEKACAAEKERLGTRLCVIDPKKYEMSDAVAFMTGAKEPPKSQ